MLYWLSIGTEFNDLGWP